MLVLELLKDTSNIDILLKKGRITYDRLLNIKLVLKKKVYVKLMRTLVLEKLSDDLLVELKVFLNLFKSKRKNLYNELLQIV